MTTEAADDSIGKPERFDERRNALAASALQTLGELGYARTSLREIAHSAHISHGVLHYYFADKLELIIAAVRQYKSVCVRRYDRIVTDARTALELKAGFADALVQTLRDDGPAHRLWYDVRTQSFYEPGLRADVQEIDDSLRLMVRRVVSRFFELSGPSHDRRVDAQLSYALFDGIFQAGLISQVFGDTGAAARLRANAIDLLEGLLATS